MGIGGSVAGHSLKIAKEWELFGPLYLCSLLENKKRWIKTTTFMFAELQIPSLSWL